MLGRKKGSTDRGEGGRPRRGKRRSIRFDAIEDLEPRERPASHPEPPPSLMLRKLKVDEALDRLARQLPVWARRGQREMLLVHGKGQNSPGGISVLGPAVRQWCDEHPDIVSSWREAPPYWGGSGAVVVVLAEA